MTRNQRYALLTAVAIVVALLYGLFAGHFDDVLRRTGLEIAGRPAPVAEPAAPAATAVPADPAPADAKADPMVIPVFDIVRVEPTGDAVIAGQGAPGAEVEILSGETVVAKGKTNDSGEFAIVLSEPLPAGAHDLRAKTIAAGVATLSDQSVAVSVPEGGAGEVLVVLNQPNAPSRVLQIPEPAAPAAPETTVALAPATPAEPASPVAPAEALAPATPSQPATGVTDAPAAAAARGSSEPVAPSTPAAAPESAPAAPAAETAVAAAPAGTSGPSDPIPAAPVPAEASAPESPNAPAEAGETAVAATTPAGEPAPSAPAGTPAADAPAAAPSTTDPVVAVAPATEAAPSTPTATPAPAPVVPVTVEAVELENGRRLFAAGSAAAGSSVRLYVDGAPVADATTMETGRWLVEADLPLAPGDHSIRIDQIGPDGSVVARAEVPFAVTDEAVPPTGVASSGSAGVGSGTAVATRVGPGQSVIIRRGDNLWTIAKRLYGQGLRFSTIYQANTDQIRDPDLIYPGQVFIVPQGDTAWSPGEPLPPGPSVQ